MKERLDLLLVRLGYYPSREKAKRGIMAGLVYVNKGISDKAGTLVDTEAEITVRQDSCPFVGRGGLKLAKAIQVFSLELTGLCTMDIGASTGGFTDCMLQNGASKVYAVDVGYGQLDWKLRNDPRVVNLEKVNIRYLDFSLISDPLSFISADVSFISLSLVLPVAEKLLIPGGRMVCLVKPQFEAGREQVGKHGIVKDPQVHRQVLRQAVEYGAKNGLTAKAVSFSPMTGAKGNIEYLLLLEKGDPPADISDEDRTAAAGREERPVVSEEEREKTIFEQEHRFQELSQEIDQTVEEAHKILGSL